MWLWTDWLPDGHVAFEFSFGSPRVEEYIPFETEEQFAPEALRLALLARKKVLGLRKEIRSCRDAANAIAKRSRDSDYYNAAVAYACEGEMKKARRMFERAAESESHFQPEFALRFRELMKLLRDPDEFRNYIEGIIRGTRNKLKLPEMPDIRFC